MKTIRLAAAALALSCEAAPTVDPGSVRFVQDAASHRVTVEYTLSGEPGVVTLDIETNCVDETGTRWASIGLENVTHASGDVNQIVASGTATRTIKWNANKSWPGHRIEAEGARAVVKAWSTNAPPDYMVVNLLNGRRFYYETEAQLPEGIGSDLYRRDAMVFRRIHAAGATALLGSSQQEVGRGTSYYYYETARWVSFTKDFYLGVFEVTHGQFRNVVGRSTWDGKIFTNAVDILVRPCEIALYRSYGNDGGLCTGGAWPNADPAEARKAPAGSFFASLRGLSGFGVELGLPTAAQWEFACRAGSRTSIHGGRDLSVATGGEDAGLSRYARYRYNGGYADGGATVPDAGCSVENGTARVGSYEPNAWGLYDMLGNVWEWCYDAQGALSNGSVVDPGGQSLSDNYRCLRGGSWRDNPSACRASSHFAANCWADKFPDGNIGFRVCIELP